MPQKVLTDLPADVVGHIVARLALAFHVARAAPTCKVVSVAARNAIRARRFSAEVVALVEEQVRDGKKIIFKKKRRKNHRRSKGFRAQLTGLRVLEVRGIDE